MSVDLIKLQEDLSKMKAILKEYTTIFEASDGIDSEEQKELDRMQGKINLLEGKIQELLGDNIVDTTDPTIAAFEKKWMHFIQELEGDIIKYGLDVPQQ